jgi:hypothetical protein
MSTLAPEILAYVDVSLDDPVRRVDVLHAMRLTEAAPSLLGVGAHLLTVARR